MAGEPRPVTRHGTGQNAASAHRSGEALLEAGHPSTLIIPLTTNLVEDAEPLRIRMPVSARLRQSSDLLIDQLRAIDNRRLGQGPLARLSPALMSDVNEAVREVLDLDES